MPKRLVLILLLLSGQVTGAPPELVLNTTFSPPLVSKDKSGFLDRLYSELFGRLGIEFKIQALPGERALIDANAGIDDGDVGRIDQLGGAYPNLVHGEEPVMEYRMAVFSRRHEFRVAGPESLKPYDVGIVIGWKIIERTVTGTHSVMSVGRIEQLFSLLERDRIDLVVFSDVIGLETLKRMGITDIRMLQPPLLRGNWYLHLNKKHAALLPRIDAELRRMKQDGSYARIENETLGSYRR